MSITKEEAYRQEVLELQKQHGFSDNCFNDIIYLFIKHKVVPAPMDQYQKQDHSTKFVERLDKEKFKNINVPDKMAQLNMAAVGFVSGLNFYEERLGVNGNK